MKLRKLKQKDALLMLEWMHDRSVVDNLKKDFVSKTEADCLRFIETSQDDQQNMHLAIVNDKDEYQGTVSLKHIHDKTAEFAITVRASAMGTGIAKAAMKEIMSIAIYDKDLEYVYWCVSPENKRAIAFYDKNGYERVKPIFLPIDEEYSKEQIESYIWYSFSKKK